HAPLGHLGWWQVMKYWRTLFGDDPNAKLEVRGYQDASASTQATQDREEAAVLRTPSAGGPRLGGREAEPQEGEKPRESNLRAAITDTSWSAAFISYVIRQSGVSESAFQFSNAHRAYIYGAFMVTAAESKNSEVEGVYRACPLGTTRPREGDMICQHREPALA